MTLGGTRLTSILAFLGLLAFFGTWNVGKLLAADETKPGILVIVSSKGLSFTVLKIERVSSKSRCEEIAKKLNEEFADEQIRINSRLPQGAEAPIKIPMCYDDEKKVASFLEQIRQ